MNSAPRRQARIERLESRFFLSATDIVRNGGFEGTVSPADWGLSGSFQADSRFSNYHSGHGYAYLADANGGAANSIAGKLFQQVTIPADASAATFSFWTKITTTETTTTTQNDKLTVSILDATGTTVLQSLTTLSNLDASSSYMQKTFSLSPALIGQTVEIYFSGVNNASLATTFRVDDVSLLAEFPGAAAPMRVVGYLPEYRYSLFGQMDLNQVTHINYFSIGVTADGTLTAGSVNVSHMANVVSAMHALGKTVSITLGPASFATMAASSTARTNFANNIANYITTNNLDGVDIDWEPPASTATNQTNYGLLINTLVAKLHPMGKLVTAAVNPWTHEIPAASANQMDWLNIMCYDFDYANSSTYSASVGGMNGWASFGVAKDKLVMGVPFYGRYGTSWSDTHAKTYGGILTDYKNINGAYPAPNIDNYLDAAGNRTYFNGQATMQQKMAFLRDNGFGGTMIWELGQDHWDAAVKYDNRSQLPIIGTMMNPPGWLSPGVGSTFNLVNGQFYLNLGSVTLLSDVSGMNPGLAMNLDAGSSLVLNASQRLSGLNIADTGSVNLKGNYIILDYSGASSPIGSWNGSAYTGLTALIQSGRNGGAWNGKGIMTSMSSAKSPSVMGTIGVAEASSALGISGSATKLWNGKIVDATTVLLRYTYGGDANLDGAINGDDYFNIDAGFASAGHGFGSGDFNYDGRIDGDDYFIIDSNYNKPGTPLASAAVPPASAMNATVFRDGQAIGASVISQTHQRRLIDELESTATELV